MPVSIPNNSQQSLLANQAPIALISPYNPHQTLVIHKGNSISQQQFLFDLHKITNQLPNARFALNLCEDRYYFMLAFCALLLKNSTNLLAPNRQTSTLLELAQDYSGCYCLFDTDQACELPALNIHNLLEAPISPHSVTMPFIPAQQLAAIAFTSGSTGKPKPNPKCWGTLAATAQLLGQRLTTELNLPTLIATVPSQHMYGLETTLMMALQAGAIMHSAKPFFPADIKTLLSQIEPPCILVSTPIHLRALVNAELTMPTVAGIISATAPLDQPIAQASEACFNARLWEIFGCTEAGSMATRRTTQTDVWELLQTFSLSIENDQVIARAPHLSLDAPIQDQISLISADKFLLLGRNADMINVAGKRASLSQLTSQLLRIDGVIDGVVFLPSDNSHAQERRPVALVVSDLPEKIILNTLANFVDPAFLPRPLRKIKKLPRNETGKLTATALNNLWSQLGDTRPIDNH
jgi:acyl-coenzyme A synthetase/AMP-(fatty) acid ligase